MSSSEGLGDRRRSEALVSSDVGPLLLILDGLSRSFAERGAITAQGLRALIVTVAAEAAATELTAGELCRQMRVSQAATSGLIARLSDAGYVRRDVDPTDRRKVILHSTESGRHLLGDFFADVTAHVSDALDDLPGSDLEAGHRVFSALVAGGADLARRAPPSLDTGASSSPPAPDSDVHGDPDVPALGSVTGR